jgi:hypothetical protein
MPDDRDIGGGAVGDRDELGVGRLVARRDRVPGAGAELGFRLDEHATQRERAQHVDKACIALVDHICPPILVCRNPGHACDDLLGAFAIPMHADST